MDGDQDHLEAPQGPQIAIRRWGDGCFHPVEEELPEGFVVNGTLIPRDEVTHILELATGRLLLSPRDR